MVSLQYLKVMQSIHFERLKIAQVPKQYLDVQYSLLHILIDNRVDTLQYPLNLPPIPIHLNAFLAYGMGLLTLFTFDNEG